MSAVTRAILLVANLQMFGLRSGEMKEYEITFYVPKNDLSADRQDNSLEDDGRWLDTGCAFVMGAVVMLLVLLP